MNKPNKLRIVPLGGLGEIGRNLLAIEYGSDIVVVDAGLMFPEQEMLGIDLVIPNIAWLVERTKKVRGIVLTHGHEDHIGGLPYILPRLPVPVYGSALTVGLLRNKLKEHRLLDSVKVQAVEPGTSIKLGVFTVEFIRTTHSIPDACALAIRTPLGTIVHTGDFKIDQTPVNGEPPDIAYLARLGDEGVLLLLSDSTNVETEGITPSESTIGPTLDNIFAAAPKRIFMATFASNISRLQQAFTATEAAGRRCFLAGRSMLNNVSVAQNLGYLKVAKNTLVWPRQLSKTNTDRLVVLCTGSQGEPLSALTRIAAGEHSQVRLHRDDTVILSASPIPGNEELIHRTINNLYKRGAHVLHSAKDKVHVSGHASREELKLMLALVKPKYFIPVHGEYRHLAIHAELAAQVGIAKENIMAIDNGKVVEIDENGIRLTNERAPVGYVYVDGLSIEGATDVVLRDRQLLSQDGIIIVVLVIDLQTGTIAAKPEIISRGFVEDSTTEKVFDQALEEITRLTAKLSEQEDWTVWQATIHEGLSRFIYQKTKRRPMILPVITEV